MKRGIAGDRIRALRDKTGLSQKDFANLAKLSDGQVKRYELGSAEPPYSTLLWYADYFNVSVDWILGRVDEPSVKLITLSDNGTSKEVIGIHKDSELTPEMLATIRRIAREVQQEVQQGQKQD